VQSGPHWPIMTARQADLLVLLSAAIWGLAYSFQKAAMDHVGPFTYVAARAIIATICLFPFAWREGLAPGLPRAAVTGGVLFFIGAALQQVGMVTASATNAAFLTALYVVATVIMAWILFHRRPGFQLWLAVGLSLAGALGLAGGRLSGLGHGDWLIIMSALLWAGYNLNTEQAGQLRRPIAYTCGVFATVGLLALGPAVLTETATAGQIRDAAPYILFVGVLSTAFTFGLFSLALTKIPGPRASIILSTETIFAAIAAYLILGERLASLGWAGAGLIVLSVLVVQWPARGR
jgi:drug/metabolite transporter (DMT)-like permease